MRKSCRYPVLAIIFMALVGAVIAALMFTTGVVFEVGRSFVLTVAAALAAAVIITVLLFALRRAGAQRLAEVRTWPQD